MGAPVFKRPDFLNVKRQTGFSLIEMLVGVLIITFGLLGLITLQSRALVVSGSSEDSQRAAILAQEMASTLINLNTTDVNPAVIDKWAQRVADPTQGGVPNGVGTVVPASKTQARITVTWRAVQAASGAANETHTYATDVIL